MHSVLQHFQLIDLIFYLAVAPGVVSPGWVSDGTFLAGYGAAQALPGPLFTFAAYLGAVAATSPDGVVGALIALAAIFMPGMLALLAVMPFWPALRAKANARAVMAGVNASVVGLLATACGSAPNMDPHRRPKLTPVENNFI